MASRFYTTNILLRHRKTLVFAYIFCLPLKLAAAYVFLIPLTVFWLLNNLRNFKNICSPFQDIVAPFAYFLLALLCSAFFGVNIPKSLENIASLTFYSFSFFVVMEAIESKKDVLTSLALLATAAVLASSHSILDAAFNDALPGLFIGTVTESGQLVLVTLSLLGTLIFTGKTSSSNPVKFQPVYGLLLFAVILSATYSGNNLATIILAGGLGLLITHCYSLLIRLVKYSRLDNHFNSWLDMLLKLTLPVLICALIVNLKRGPWLGVIVGSIVLLGTYKPKLLIPKILALALLFACISPLWARLVQSMSDFFISGGRNEIWEIGGYLSKRYPLGIGLGNSVYLRQFSTTIPPELRHFHSNFLNILVEGGWAALAFYIWWLFSIFKLAFQKRNLENGNLIFSIGVAILGWQVAGLVEYNFGDSEVWLLVLVLLANLAFLLKSNESDMKA